MPLLLLLLLLSLLMLLALTVLVLHFPPSCEGTDPEANDESVFTGLAAAAVAATAGITSFWGCCWPKLLASLVSPASRDEKPQAASSLLLSLLLPLLLLVLLLLLLRRLLLCRTQGIFLRTRWARRTRQCLATSSSTALQLLS